MTARCEAVNAAGERCGYHAGHRGRHTSLIASEFLHATPSHPERAPALAVDFSRSTTQDVAVEALTPRSPVEADAPATLQELAQAVFPNSRSMTAEERAAFDASAYGDAEPITIGAEAPEEATATAYQLAMRDLHARRVTNDTEEAIAARVSQLEATVAETERQRDEQIADKHRILRGYEERVQSERAARLSAEQERDALRAAAERFEATVEHHRTWADGSALMWSIAMSQAYSLLRTALATRPETPA